MVIFFFLLGLEIKREVLAGDLARTENRRMLILCAVGGMICPAAIYLITAIILDLIILASFVWIKIFSDPLVVGVASAIILAMLIVEVLFLRHNPIVPAGHNHG